MIANNLNKSLLRAWLATYRMPLLAFALLTLSVNFNVWDDHDPARRALPEVFGTHLGHEINSVWVGIGILLLVTPSLLAWARSERDVWVWRVLDAVALDFLVVDAFGKRFLAWPRPNFPATLAFAGFPSGHATAAFLLAWLIWKRYPKLGPFWFGMAALIGWSRVENQAHFPYQVIAGAAIGMGLGLLICSRETGVFFPRILLSDGALHALLDRLLPDLRPLRRGSRPARF